MTATVGVLGPGAVGGALAVRLALAGNRVICVAREDTSAAIVREGLILELPHETLAARPEAIQRLEEPVDLLLVTVKAFALDQALGRVDPAAVKEGVAVPLLNGLEHVEQLRGRLGSRVAVGSIGRLEAHRLSTTTIVQETRRPLVSIASDTLSRDSVAVAVDLLETAETEVRVLDSERMVLWEKAARLAPLAAVTALTRRPLGDLREDPDWRGKLLAAIDETCEVAAREGVDVSPAVQWEMIEAMPAALTTSTARDVAAGRPSELDAIVGGVVRAGRRLGVPTPTLDDMLSLLEAA